MNNNIYEISEPKGNRCERIEKDFALEPGIIFVPPDQIDDWKAHYLVIGEVKGCYLCCRISFEDERLAGTYDIVWDNIIIETWNALTVLKNSETKGYERIPDEVIAGAVEVRKAWIEGIRPKPSVSYLTGRDIFSDPDRLLFHERELQANESLDAAWDEGSKQFPRIRLWEEIGTKVCLNEQFDELKHISSCFLSAYIDKYSPFLFLLWESDNNTSPPQAFIREVASGLFLISQWEELKPGKIWQSYVTIPDGAESVVLKLGERECSLEVLPREVYHEEVLSDLPLSLVLFRAFRESEQDSATLRPDDLLSYRFGVLEQGVRQEVSRCLLPGDRAVFELAAGLCCEGLADITRLKLFQDMEKALAGLSRSDADTVFGTDILSRLLTWRESGFHYSPEWFYRHVFGAWFKELEKFKSVVSETAIFTQEDMEASILAFMNESPLINKFYAAVRRHGRRAHDLVSQLVNAIRIPVLSAAPLRVSSGVGRPLGGDLSPEETEHVTELTTVPSINLVPVNKPEEWYGIFEAHSGQDEDVNRILGHLEESPDQYWWNGLYVRADEPNKPFRLRDQTELLDMEEIQGEKPSEGCGHVTVYFSRNKDGLEKVLCETEQAYGGKKEPALDKTMLEQETPLVFSITYLLKFNLDKETTED